jgi:hypothetical protein
MTLKRFVFFFIAFNFLFLSCSKFPNNDNPGTIVVSPSLKIGNFYVYEFSVQWGMPPCGYKITKMIKIIDTFSLNNLNHYVLFTADSSNNDYSLGTGIPSSYCSIDGWRAICKSEVKDTCFEKNGVLTCTSHEQIVGTIAEIFRTKICNSAKKFSFNSDSLPIFFWDTTFCWQGECRTNSITYVHEIGLLKKNYHLSTSGTAWFDSTLALVSINGVEVKQ